MPPDQVLSPSSLLLLSVMGWRGERISRRMIYSSMVNLPQSAFSTSHFPRISIGSSPHIFDFSCLDISPNYTLLDVRLPDPAVLVDISKGSNDPVCGTSYSGRCATIGYAGTERLEKDDVQIVVEAGQYDETQAFSIGEKKVKVSSFGDFHPIVHISPPNSEGAFMTKKGGSLSLSYFVFVPSRFASFMKQSGGSPSIASCVFRGEEDVGEIGSNVVEVRGVSFAHLRRSLQQAPLSIESCSGSLTHSGLLFKDCVGTEASSLFVDAASTCSLSSPLPSSLSITESPRSSVGGDTTTEHIHLPASIVVDGVNGKDESLCWASASGIRMVDFDENRNDELRHSAAGWEDNRNCWRRRGSVDFGIFSTIFPPFDVVGNCLISTSGSGSVLRSSSSGKVNIEGTSFSSCSSSGDGGVLFVSRGSDAVSPFFKHPFQSTDSDRHVHSSGVDHTHCGLLALHCSSLAHSKQLFGSTKTVVLDSDVTQTTPLVSAASEWTLAAIELFDLILEGDGQIVVNNVASSLSLSSLSVHLADLTEDRTAELVTSVNTCFSEWKKPVDCEHRSQKWEAWRVAVFHPTRGDEHGLLECPHFSASTKSLTLTTEDEAATNDKKDFPMDCEHDRDPVNVDPEELFRDKNMRNSEKRNDDKIFTHRDSASQTQRRATKMEEQRRGFGKGQISFELDSVFVCSTTPLSDLTVSLDIKPSNNPKTVRDAIDKNDGLDKKAQSLWIIKIIALDEFDEVVFPEEFNIIAGAGQSNTGPKKPNLTMSVPSGGDSDAKMKKVPQAFQKRKFQLTRILQVRRVSSISPSFSLLLPLLLDTGVANCGEYSAGTTCGVGCDAHSRRAVSAVSERKKGGLGRWTVSSTSSLPSNDESGLTFLFFSEISPSFPLASTPVQPEVCLLLHSPSSPTLSTDAVSIQTTLHLALSRSLRTQTNPTRSRLQRPPNLSATMTLLHSASTKQGAWSLPIHSRPLRPLPSILAVAPLPIHSAPQQCSLVFLLLTQFWSCLMVAERGGMGERLYRRAVFPRLLCFCLFPPCSLIFSTQLRTRWRRVDV
ncbi:hypothetical protein BLNAU_9238 [Blattamonas nauphoetae]|uniref:Uncharacterized protein n=1 Tax=Blattamonas nauphoetae TaxID=2049346 RepID=A0ABQ9XWM5_9EUKA|nr:hypothetical protein BLNAU_9238 [Blattamonas nauphoetae]